MNFVLHCVDTVTSTNLSLKGQREQGAKLGTALLARTQTAGKGRGDHVWSSPPGGVYLSVLLAPRPQRPPTDLSILSGVAMSQAVRECIGDEFEVGIKWPNDCLLNQKKVGGILCEVVPGDAEGVCVVGMGVNVDLTLEELKPFNENPFSATSMKLQNPSGQFVVRQVAEVLLKKLSQLYAAYLKEGFGPVQLLWERNCAFIGKKVEITATTGSSSAPKVVGVFLGLDEQGAMVVAVGSRGERRKFVSGEVTCYWP